jgi:hypothetical protein
MQTEVVKVARCIVLAFVAWSAFGTAATAEESLPQRIDALLLKQAGGAPVAPVADDAEFLRRVTLDLAGRIPSAPELQAFLADRRANKRALTVDTLLASPDYPRRMQDLFNAMLMERRGDNPEWATFLETAFQTNTPWDRIARDILDPDADDPKKRGAAFFYTKRLDKVGTQDTDYPGLTRDVGRLFLGMDLQCAQCHNHLFIDNYKQQDFQGLFIVYQNTAIRGDVKFPAISEKPLTKKIEFVSVFDKIPLSTGPKVPGMAEMKLPEFKAGEEYAVPPNKQKNTLGTLKFSPLEAIAHELPTPKNQAFVRNIVNRLWFVMFGRGLVNPLDQQHPANPPSHADVMELLSQEFVAHKFDIKWLLRELALTEAYQRSTVLPSSGEVKPDRFTVGSEKRLSAEQVYAAMLVATGPWPKSEAKTPPAEATKPAAASGKPAAPVPVSAVITGPLPETQLRAAFIKAFANAPQDPEIEFTPSLKSALFLLNDPAVLGLLTPHPGNLMERLTKAADDKVADELYRSVLSREPTEEERSAAQQYLQANAKRRAAALTDLAWSVLASTEFAVNH